MKKLFFTLVFAFCIFSCSYKNSDNEEIKKTTLKYLTAIKNNDSVTYKNLIYNSVDFPGGVSSDLFFLHKNFSKINKDNFLFKNIKVKDTFDTGVQQKYVKYTLVKPTNNKPYKTEDEDLKLYLFFWKHNGYDKINEVLIIGDMPEWEDQKPLFPDNNFN